MTIKTGYENSTNTTLDLNRLQRGLHIVILILATPSFVLGLSRILIPHDMDQTFLTWMVGDLLTTGRNPWSVTSVLTPPFCIPAYGPNYFLLSAIAQGIFGDQYWLLRLISFSANIVICLFIAKIAMIKTSNSGNITQMGDNESNSRSFGSLIAVVAMLGSTTFISNIAVGRPDNLGLAFSLCGMALLISSISRNNCTQKSITTAGILIGMAPLFKQNFISAIIVGIFITYRHGSWKRFAVSAIGLPFLVVLVLVITSQGGFLEICLRYPSLPEKTIQNAINVFLKTFVKTPSNVLIMAGLGLALLPMVKSLRKSNVWRQQLVDISPLLLWLFLSGSLALLTSQRKLGGSPLYWYEFLAVSCIVTGRLVNMTIQQRKFSFFQFRAWLTWTVALLIVASVFQLRSLRGNYFEWAARPYYLELQQIVATKTPVNEPTLSYFSEVSHRAGRDVLFNDLLLYHQTTPENRRLLNDKIKEKTFSCLLLQPQNAEDYLTADYVEVKTQNTFPDKIYAVKLYLRSDLVR